MPAEKKLVSRKRYLDALTPFKGNGNAKVITGIRRCGKSSLLDTFIETIPEKYNVIMINMEFAQNDELKNWKKMLEYVESKLDKKKENILIVNEVQDITQWELAIRDLIAKESCDIYLTGSNSNLLSSEYSTYLGGRYDTVHMLPLSFSECVEFNKRYKGESDRDKLLERFIRVGGFPIIWRFDQDEDSAIKTVRTLVDSSINNDIAIRYSVRNVDFVKKVLKTVASTVGSYVSAINIYNTLASSGAPVSKETVYDYLEYLEAANLIIKAETMDIRGRAILRSSYKYYLTDLAIKHALIGYRPEDISGHIENIIFTELLGRGYNVNVGRSDEREVDIVAEKGDERIYVQACTMFGSDETVRRELGSLESIRDNYPKFVVLKDPGAFRGVTSKGIVICGLMEFIEMENYRITP
ncbi:MAG: ATP-binding protein [Candidatus Methanoplasma sp.]|nr:ATP-binding protein [Candidatus Methanoplasma sp.]